MNIIHQKDKDSWKIRHVFSKEIPIKASFADHSLNAEQTAIFREFNNYSYTNSMTKNHKLSKLSTINLFVGANNSGKSRLLRQLLKFYSNEVAEARSNSNNYQYYLKQKLEELRSSGLNLQNAPGQADLFFNESQKTVSLGGIVSHLNFIEGQEKAVNPLIENENINFDFIDRRITTLNSLIEQEYRRNDRPEEIVNFIQFINKSVAEGLSLIQAHQIKNAQFIYIPTMRGITYLHGGKEEAEDVAKNKYLENIYENTVVENYFKVIEDHLIRSFSKETRENKFIHISTGFSLYHDIKSMLLGRQSDRDKISLYQKFLSERVFDGKEVTLIPFHSGDSENDHTLWVKIGDSEDREIYNLGDGVQSLITLTFPMFVYDEALFFIEEPELHMHPGMQRKFIDILKYFAAQPKKYHQYFITTHSNHLLDLALDFKDISIYNFSVDESKKFVVSLASAADRDSLDLLGVQNSSVFLSNCIIWVEGPSDRIYFKKFLDLFLEHSEKYRLLRHIIQEGIHYSFVFSGGNTISHLDFSEDLEDLLENPSSSVKFIFGRSMVIVDNDENNKKKEPAKEKLRDQLGEDFHELKQSVETENLLPLNAIIYGIKGYESWKKLSQDLLNEIIPEESEIGQELIYKTRLGTLIQNHILKKVNPEHPSYQAELTEKITKEIKMKLKLKFADEKSSVKASVDARSEGESGIVSTSKDKENSSKTLTDKVAFARNVCEKLCWEDINKLDEKDKSLEAVELTNKILDFILRHNPDLRAILE